MGSDVPFDEVLVHNRPALRSDVERRFFLPEKLGVAAPASITWKSDRARAGRQIACILERLESGGGKARKNRNAILVYGRYQFPRWRRSSDCGPIATCRSCMWEAGERIFPAIQCAGGSESRTYRQCGGTLLKTCTKRASLLPVCGKAWRRIACVSSATRCLISSCGGVGRRVNEKSQVGPREPSPAWNRNKYHPRHHSSGSEHPFRDPGEPI